jgi:glycosyltransferase involved in cell wall biosynthesis
MPEPMEAGELVVNGRSGDGEPTAHAAVRVIAFTGGRASPSARFRVRQYIPRLAGLGVDVVERCPGLGSYPPKEHWLRPAWLIGSLLQRIPHIMAGWTDDVTLLHREMISTLYTLEGLTRRPRLVDVDDAIHLFRHGWAARRLAKAADLVVVGNEWLAEIWRRWNSNVEVLPTAVDTDFYRVEPLPENPSIGWMGSAGNLRYLESIAPALAEVVRRFPDLSIAVCSEQAPNLPGLPVRYVPWSVAAEDDFLASLTVGVMPLDDGLWERGKCSFKMLQYMAAARPCVVSPVGMNKDILAQAEVGLAATTHSEWVAALSEILVDRGGAQQLGTAGRALVQSRYSLAALTPRLAQLIRRLARSA